MIFDNKTRAIYKNLFSYKYKTRAIYKNLFSYK